MKTSIYLDIPEPENEWEAAKAKEHQICQISEICDQWGFNALVHGEGCEILTSNWKKETDDPLETVWRCLAGVAEDLEALESSWLSGAEYEALAFSWRSEPQEWEYQ